jgi:hypothetical protein
MSIEAGFQAALDRAGIPVTGVSFGLLADRTTWRIDYQPQATAQQRSDGEALKLSYDVATDTAYRTEQEQARFDGEKLVKAVAIWTAQKLGVAPATARAEILAIYRSL